MRVHRIALTVSMTAAVLGLLACESTTNPPQVTVGSIRVMTNTTGADLDLSAYRVGTDGEDTRLIEWADTAFFNNLNPGLRQVWLQDVADNCTWAGPQEVAVTAGESTDVILDVSCAELPPAEVDVSGTWEGEWEGTDHVTGKYGQGTVVLELTQDGDDVTGTQDGQYELVGRVSGHTLTLFVLGWTRPFNHYQHRYNSTAEVTADYMEGDTHEQNGEYSGTFNATRQ